MTDYFNAPNISGEGTHRLAFSDTGDKTAPACLCVHGLTRNHHDFDWLGEALVKAGYRVIALTMQGRGESDRSENPAIDYSYPAYVADCTALLDHLSLPTVHWLGTSMGGIIGMMMATFAPERIKSLFLNDVGSHIPAAALEVIAEYAGNPPKFDTVQALALYLRELYASFGLQGDDQWKHFIKYSIEEHEGQFCQAYDPEILTPMRLETENFTAIKDVDLSELWNTITAPTLIYHGKQSQLLTEQNAQSMHTSRSNVSLKKIPNCGHAPALMDDNQMTGILDWLNTL